jgi:hypothetical protein
MEPIKMMKKVHLIYYLKIQNKWDSRIILGFLISKKYSIMYKKIS